MMTSRLRALHVVEPCKASWPDLASLAVLTRADGSAGLWEHHALLLGGTPAARRAELFGVDSTMRVAPALGRTALAGSGLRRVWDAAGPWDVLVAWSPESAGLVRRVLPGAARVAVLNTPPGRERSRPSRAASLALRRSDLLIFPSAYVRDVWVAALTLLGSPSTVLHPASVPTGPAHASREELRAGWLVSESCIVIAACGEPAREIDARAMAHAAGVLGVAGLEAAVVLPPDADQVERALRFGESVGLRARVLIDDRPFPALLPGCDVALWLERPNPAALRRRFSPVLSALGLHAAALAGLPCAAHDDPVVRDGPGAGRVIFTRETDGPGLTRALFDAIDQIGPRHDQTEKPRVFRERFERLLAGAIGEGAGARARAGLNSARAALVSF